MALASLAFLSESETTRSPFAVLLDPNKTHKMRRLKSNYNWRSPRGAFMDLVLNVKYQLIVKKKPLQIQDKCTFSH